MPWKWDFQWKPSWQTHEQHGPKISNPYTARIVRTLVSFTLPWLLQIQCDTIFVAYMRHFRSSNMCDTYKRFQLCNGIRHTCSWWKPIACPNSWTIVASYNLNRSEWNNNSLHGTINIAWHKWNAPGKMYAMPTVLYTPLVLLPWLNDHSTSAQCSSHKPRYTDTEMGPILLPWVLM